MPVAGGNRHKDIMQDLLNVHVTAIDSYNYIMVFHGSYSRASVSRAS